MILLVTGGSGFIGSNFIRYILQTYPSYKVINYDLLTYAGNQESLRDLETYPNYKFVKGNITNGKRINQVIKRGQVTHIVNFAAESHVDRSISNPSIFMMTNVVGTQVLLQAALKNNIKRFHHVSTDEVYGSLSLHTKEKFNDKSVYDPRSPYSASKAGSDHIVNAYFHTYGLPVTISNCSNNFGPYQHPEKFLPRAITNLIEDKPIMIYGDGKNVRDWLHVLDHCRAIDLILHKGNLGETYLIGGQTTEVNNLSIAKKLIKIFGKDKKYIEFIQDRVGHDKKYAVDWSRIKKELGWAPLHDFDHWLLQTVDWYKGNTKWWKSLKIKTEKYYRNLNEQKVDIKLKEYVKETSIKGLQVIQMPTAKDNRGFFREVGRVNMIKKFGKMNFQIKQWNHSQSKPKVIRALHAENWNKLVYPVTGKMFAALVDIRPESETFGKIETINFSENGHKALLIPKGVANSICVIGNKSVNYLYLVDSYYDGKDMRAIAWNDPDLNIAWPVKNPIISERDKNNPTLREMYPEKFK